MMFCHNCGKQLEQSRRYCVHCGAQNIVTLAEIVATDSSSNPAAVTGAAPLTANPVSPAMAAAGLTAGIAAAEVVERQLFSARQTMLPVIVAYAAAAVASLVLTALIAYFGGSLWIALGLAALLFAYPAYRQIQRNAIVYTLTTSKIAIEYGLFNKTTRNIPLRHIQDVTVSASLTERLLGIGNILIDSAADGGKIPMNHVNNPRQYADQILAQLKR